jgi:molybdopterin/thiamine biosynthesis adenylyltransferase
MSGNTLKDSFQMYVRRSPKESNENKVRVYITRQALDAINLARRPKGTLWGYFRREEAVCQIQSCRKGDAAPGTKRIGAWTKKNGNSNRNPIFLKINRDHCDVSVKGEKAELVAYDLSDRDLRFRDLIADKDLPGKHVFVFGCGSVGSRIARELNRYGIRLTLVDMDSLEIHNLLRWGFGDFAEAMVGRKKVFVIKEMCEKANPAAQVRAEARNFCEDIAYFDALFKEDRPSLVIASTDTADSLRDCNSLCLQYGIPALYVGLSDGAESGQIFFASGKPEDPCLGCIMEEPSPAVSLRQTTENYAAEESQAQHAVPALSTDIAIVSDLAAKVAPAFLSGADLRQYFKNFDNTGEVLWFSTTPNTWIMEDFAQKVVAKVLKNPDCLACGRM